MEPALHDLDQRAKAAEESANKLIGDYLKTLEASAKEHIEMAAEVSEKWNALQDELFRGQGNYVSLNLTAANLKELVVRLLSALKKVDSLVDLFQSAGLGVRGADRLKEALVNLRAIQEDVNDWPFDDPTVAHESLDAYRRGDYRTAEDALNDAKGNSADSD